MYFVRTFGGNVIPLDREPVVDGNMVIYAGMAVAYMPLLHQGRARYVAHFATCPNADRHRKARS